MQTQISKWGGSCAVRIPKMAVESLGLSEGTKVNLSLEDGALVLRVDRNDYTLEELVEQAKGQECLEYVWGHEDVGKEVW